MYRDPNFMVFRRNPIVSRAIDSISNKNIEDFGYLPAEGFISLLTASNSLNIGKEAISALQKFLCKKVEYKRTWNDGDA